MAIIGAVVGYFAKAVQDSSCTGDGAAIVGAIVAESKILHHWATETDDPVCPDGLLMAGPAPTPLSVCIYMALLLWSFVGVAIGADVFMMSIEMITSQEKKVVRKVGGQLKEFTVLVWNATISNLTLMALGSSAPEILLSVIEIVSSGFYAGELGPSTIVGSAAFNLLVISAVCVIAIPAGEGRFIKERPVFYITAFFSVAAYLWLLVILMIHTPNIVDVTEGLLTFFFFPLLVYLAYLADQGYCSCHDTSATDSDRCIAIAKDGRAINIDDALVAYSPNLTKEQQAAKVQELMGKPKTRAYYRANAVRSGTGGKVPISANEAVGDAIFSFQKQLIEVQPGDSWVDVYVVRTGNTSIAASIGYRSVSHVSTGEGLTEGTIDFSPGQRESYVRMAVLGNEAAFYLVLINPSPGADAHREHWKCVVLFGQENAPGMLKFEHENMTIKESEHVLWVTISRVCGASGAITFSLKTKDETAFAGTDYVGIDTEVYMASGQVSHTFPVHVKDDDAYENDETFQLILSDGTGGATFDPTTNGGGEKAVATVTIVSDDAVRNKLDELAVNFINSDDLSLSGASWAEQFHEAVEYEGELSFLGVCMYLAALPWKVIFAFTPPTRIGGGWVCFFVTLCLIGILTACIGDLAAHMGCSMGMLPSITAITFVALGTSLPDTFASKTAAVTEAHADSSIGNITGSNSVNVFLGLGMPWALAAIYWSYGSSESAQHEWRQRYKSEPWYTPDMPIGFVVNGGDLGFSVSVFAACALVCLGTLLLRRATLGFELGGPRPIAVLTSVFFVFLWFVYIGSSVMYTYGLV